MVDERLLRVRDELERRVAGDQGVSLIDVGTDPRAAGRQPAPLAVRVHVRSAQDASRLRSQGIAEPVEGVPVVLIEGDYGLERPSS